MDKTDDLLIAYYRAWSRQDRAGVISFFADVATFEDLAFSAKFEGLEQIRSFVDLTYAGSPDFCVEPIQIVANGNTAAAEWTMSGTHSGDFPGLPATGKRFSVRAVSMVNFANGKIQRIADYWNPLDFRQSVGMV